MSIYAGRALETPLGHTVGIGAFVPITDWALGDGYLVAATFSRRVLSIGSFAELELEAGVGQRVGSGEATEGWIALFARWTSFPWNHIVRTTVAVSTGLNYASGAPAYERARSGNGEGSRLLHFYSPEITFADPKAPDRELFVRVHHRSGGRVLFGPIDLFNGVDGGAQFLSVGARFRY